MNAGVGLVYDERYLLHNPGNNHPETAERLKAILSHVERQPWYGELRHYSPRFADREWLANIHSLDYIRRAKQASEKGLYILDTEDVGISPESYQVALLAAGGALEIADKTLAGEIKRGFVLARPPGHHAEHDRAMGFCIFNNVAILARYLQKKHGLEKILILDWDVHHGNGTQHIFEADPSVFYISLHQYPFYPGTGSSGETGLGRGKGSTLNCPMKEHSGDNDYMEAFSQKILPSIRRFGPDFILLSSGFDAHRKDPLGNIKLTSECFEWMTLRVCEAAENSAEGRLISLLEGGYHMEALAECVGTHLKALLK